MIMLEQYMLLFLSLFAVTIAYVTVLVTRDKRLINTVNKMVNATQQVVKHTLFFGIALAFLLAITLAIKVLQL